VFCSLAQTTPIALCSFFVIMPKHKNKRRHSRKEVVSGRHRLREVSRDRSSVQPREGSPDHSRKDILRSSSSSGNWRSSRESSARRYRSRDRFMDLLDQVRDFLVRRGGDHNLPPRNGPVEVSAPKGKSPQADVSPSILSATLSPTPASGIEEPAVAQADRGVVPGMSPC